MSKISVCVRVHVCVCVRVCVCVCACVAVHVHTCIAACSDRDGLTEVCKEAETRTLVVFNLLFLLYITLITSGCCYTVVADEMRTNHLGMYKHPYSLRCLCD